VRYTDQKAPRYVVFYTPILPCPSAVQIYSSEGYSQTASAYNPPAM